MTFGIDDTSGDRWQNASFSGWISEEKKGIGGLGTREGGATCEVSVEQEIVDDEGRLRDVGNAGSVVKEGNNKGETGQQAESPCSMGMESRLAEGLGLKQQEQKQNPY